MWHDAHGAMLLGVAKVMIDEGVLENPKVDAIFAQHVALLPGLKTGMVVIKYNQVMASSDRVDIKVKGKGGHASTPESCIDPIIMATQVINNNYKYGYPALVNSPDMACIVENSAKEVLGKSAVINMPKPVMGSEDASYLLEKSPGAYYRVVVGNLKEEGYYPAHHAKMKIDESGLVKGALVLMQSTINYLNQD